MMGIMVPPKHVERTISFAIKTNLLHLVGLLFPRINDDSRSNSHQVHIESNFVSSAPQFPERALIVGRFSRLCTYFVQVRAAFRRRWIWSIGGMTLTGGNLSARRKTSPNPTLPTTDLTWTDLGLNLGLRGVCPKTACLIHATAIKG